jgi:hypothetical protein
MGSLQERWSLPRLGEDRSLEQHWPITAALDITPLMSRHRRERVPRHRAQRSAGYPARRARVTGAVRPPGTALGGAGGDAEIGLQAAGATLETSAPAGTGLAGIGLADTEPARSGPAGTGQDATETALLAPLTASPYRAVTGLDGLTASDDGAMPGRRPASHSRRRGQQSVSTPPGSAPASGLAGKHPVVARGLLMTPWFAAATGFVIAASLWIYSPHPQLTFPAIAIGKVPRVPCDSSGCRSQADQQGAGSLAIKSGERATQQQKSAAPAKTSTRDRASTVASGFTFGYVAQRTANGNFWLTVTVAGKHPIKDWQLAFVLPGAHIQSVYGADWHAAGGDRGIASPFTGDPGQQHGGPRAPGDYGQGGADDQLRVFFTVLASGTPVGPADCSFDGASCTFRELSGPSQGMR